jgi:Zinc finger C-x8-C-x5-C-x3-H type (and similar)
MSSFVTSDGPTTEDCRDFLRTGRCKYGAACKYQHPPNIQVGGGMKTPLNPSEPLFPIRPNEPVCQYYLKHGTCKFGQACKFHHPPLTEESRLEMNVPRQQQQQQQQQHVVLNTIAGSDLILQLLPQRPEEPDCIFFLKNGRCKYGASCRYHHPVDLRRVVTAAPKVQYVAATYPQTLYRVDGPVSFIQLDSSQQQHASSLDLYESAEALRRSGSGGSLNAYHHRTEALKRPVLTSHPAENSLLHGSASEGNLFATLHRGRAQGSLADLPPPLLPHQRMGTRLAATTAPLYASRSVEHLAGRPPVSGSLPRFRRRPGPRGGPDEGDEGFTMMTSALLNMLDTPEEAAELYYEEGNDFHETVRYEDPRQTLHRTDVSQDIDFGRLSLGRPDPARPLLYPFPHDGLQLHNRNDSTTSTATMASSWSSPQWSGIQQPQEQLDRHKSMQPAFEAVHPDRHVMVVGPPPGMVCLPADDDVGLYLS